MLNYINIILKKLWCLKNKDVIKLKQKEGLMLIWVLTTTW